MEKFKEFSEKYGLEMISVTQVEDNPNMIHKDSDSIHYLIELETNKTIGTTDSMNIYFTVGSMFGEVKFEDVLYTIGMDMSCYMDDFGIGEYMDTFGMGYNEAKKVEFGIRWNSSNFIAMFNEEIAQELVDISVDY